MWWVPVLLTAEGPLAVGVAWATGHSGTALANCSYSSPEMLARPSSETQITCSKTQMKTNVYVKVSFVQDMLNIRLHTICIWLSKAGFWSQRLYQPDCKDIGLIYVCIWKQTILMTTYICQVFGLYYCGYICSTSHLMKMTKTLLNESTCVNYLIVGNINDYHGVYLPIAKHSTCNLIIQSLG